MSDRPDVDWQQDLAREELAEQSLARRQQIEEAARFKERAQAILRWGIAGEAGPGRRKVYVIQSCTSWNFDDDWETSPYGGETILAFTTLERAEEDVLAQQELHPEVPLGIVETFVEIDTPET